MKKLYVEEQKYHDLVTMSILIIIGLLLLYAAYLNFNYAKGFQMYISGVLIIAIIAGIYWTVKKLTLKIQLGKKSAKIKISPLPWTSIKVDKSDIEKIEFFKLNELDISSGALVNFGASIKIYNFGDKSGVVIKMSDGSFILIFSDKLYNNKEELKSKLKDHSWNMKIKEKVA